ncbi:hypothetical protein TI39_contig197g00001 [Zymoseptoria brevis]|uniref:Uncharacterized protein n=1 Tax=Zymoseptoria brevis TaxID=1047168 RepID=A0A0F4H0W3_9PEZI|nr:hypothetical protein TI39_contig197g00001 [Zymoseptoria brevis]
MFDGTAGRFVGSLGRLRVGNATDKELEPEMEMLRERSGKLVGTVGAAGRPLVKSPTIDENEAPISDATFVGTPPGKLVGRPGTLVGTEMVLVKSPISEVNEAPISDAALLGRLLGKPAMIEVKEA